MKLLSIILFFAACPGFALGGEIVIEAVFGPDAKVPGPYKHPASITELDNGDLYLVYYGGSGEYGDDTAVYGARKAKGSDRWTMPMVVADTPGRSEGNAVVWQAPDHKVWLFYNANNLGERMPLTVAISTDNDRTYPYRRNIVERGDTAAYPTAVQTRDGKIHVVFTSHERTQIDHAVFDESAIVK